MTLQARLERKLVRRPNNCLEWTGGTNPDGYGKLYLDGKTVATHRIAWELAYGPIPDGELIRHFVCDNPPCCEPTHLRLGTSAQNSADMVTKGRSWGQKKTHCKHGHEFTEDNTSFHTASRWRRCRECHRIEAHVAHHRNRGAA